MLLLENIFINIMVIKLVISSKLVQESELSGLADHTMVTKGEEFRYVAAIMKKTSYLSAGALIDDHWVLTAADALFLLRDSIRFLRVRIGSINNRKGGVLLPIKYFEIHPYFDDKKPEFDVALVRLSFRVRFTPNLKAIKIQTKRNEVTATHFIVTAWPASNPESKETRHLESMEVIKRHRILSVSHMHPTNPDNCTAKLKELNLDNTNLMCLDVSAGTDPCLRDSGAPVVLNGVVWGIVSSWKPEECDVEVAPTLVSLVASRNISTWLYAMLHGQTWNRRMAEEIDYDDEYNYF